MATADRYLSRIHWGGRDYAIKDFTAAESAEAAQTAATLATKAHIAALHVVSSTRELIGGDEIIEYDENITYHKDDICAHDGRIWILTALSTSGVWDATVWSETSFWQELEKIRRPLDSVEVLHLQICKETDHAYDRTFPNAPVSITVNNKTVEYTANTSGVLILQFLVGEEYSITFPDQSYVNDHGVVTPYNTPQTLTFLARNSERNVTVTYTKPESKWSVIYTDGYEVPLDEHYDAVTAGTAIDGRKNADVVLLRMSKAVTDPASLQDYNVNFCIPTKKTANCTTGTSLQWCSNQSNVLVRPKAIGTSSLAMYNFGGYKETAEILDTCAKSGYTCQAATFATRAFVSINGTKIYGHMLSSGEFYHLAGTTDLYSEFTTAMSKCGGSVYYNLRSGTWWSCSQFNAGSAWYLNDGSLDGYKTNTYSVLPVFDF